MKTALMRGVGTAVRLPGVVGLAYHRIGNGDGSDLDRGLWSATREDLDRQVRWAKKHFDVISPRDLSYVVRVKRGRHVLFSFDDGYADNFTAAYPVLQAHGVLATFFVATGFIDDPRLPWWDEIAWMIRRSRRPSIELPEYLPNPVRWGGRDRQDAIRTVLWTYYRLPASRTGAFLEALAAATATGRFSGPAPSGLWMTWDMIRTMRSTGMTIGGHTVNHPVLSRMSVEGQWSEIAGCCRRLEDELGAPTRVFAYPVGQPDSFDAHSRACLQRAGVRVAFSYYGGWRRLAAWDDYDVPRISVEQHTTFDEFRARVMAPWLTRT